MWELTPMFHESLLILLRSSLPNIMCYLHLHSNWKIVNGHLGKCADECDIQELEIFTRSPMFLSLCLCSSKRYIKYLGYEINFFGDNLKSLSK